MDDLCLENMLEEVMFLRTSMEGVGNVLVSNQLMSEKVFLEMESDQVICEPSVVEIPKGRNRSQLFQMFPKIDGVAGWVTIHVHDSTQRINGVTNASHSESFTIFTGATLCDGISTYFSI